MGPGGQHRRKTAAHTPGRRSELCSSQLLAAEFVRASIRDTYRKLRPFRHWQSWQLGTSSYCLGACAFDNGARRRTWPGPKSVDTAPNRPMLGQLWRTSDPSTHPHIHTSTQPTNQPTIPPPPPSPPLPLPTTTTRPLASPRLPSPRPHRRTDTGVFSKEKEEHVRPCMGRIASPRFWCPGRFGSIARKWAPKARNGASFHGVRNKKQKVGLARMTCRH